MTIPHPYVLQDSHPREPSRPGALAVKEDAATWIVSCQDAEIHFAAKSQKVQRGREEFSTQRHSAAEERGEFWLKLETFLLETFLLES